MLRRLALTGLLMPGLAHAQVALVDVSDAEAAHLIVQRLSYTWPVAYSDIRIRSANPVEDAHLVFSYDSSLDPSGDLNTIEAGLNVLIARYNALDHVAKFEVLVHDDRFEIAASQVRQDDGSYAAFTPSLDTHITLPKRKLAFKKAQNLVFEALDEATSHSVQQSFVGNAQFGLTGKVEIGGSQSARQHLLAVFRQEEAQGMGLLFLWDEVCPTNQPSGQCVIEVTAIHDTAAGR